jgi:hypothetical protein
MLRCEFCGRLLDETAAWKGSGERYYCNEFCAEGGEVDSPPLAPNMHDNGPALTGVLSTGATTPRKSAATVGFRLRRGRVG